MKWQQSGWQVETLAGTYDVEYSRYTRDFTAWFWPLKGHGVPLYAADGNDFATVEAAIAACEAHSGERCKLRAV